MNNVFDAIKNISKLIENKVFTNYDEFVVENDLNQTNINVQQYCDQMAKAEFKLVKDVKSIVTQDDKKTEILNEDGRYVISFIAISSFGCVLFKFKTPI